MSRRTAGIGAAIGLSIAALFGLSVLPEQAPEPAPAPPDTVVPADASQPEPGKRLSPTKLPKDRFEFRRPVVDRAPAAEGAPNVVVVLGCTLRRDQLTPYGGPSETTPWLARAAASGVVFDDVIASSSWTKESSTALFTGHQALSVGMVEPGRHHSLRVLAPEVETLAERLAAHGWYTLGVTANPHLNTDFGLAQGFDHYRDTRSSGFARKNRIHGQEVVDLALQMLDDRQEQADRPFYMRLVLIDPHEPLAIPRPEAERFAEPGLSKRLVDYRAGVRRLDDALAALDAGLAARGYTPENTLFVLVSDHGEGLNLPPHHRDQHGRVLYRSLTQVAWILRGPGVAEGARITGLASHLDTVPTLLSLLDLPGDPALPGLDLSPLVRANAPERQTPRRQAFTDTWYFGANRSAVFTDAAACQRDFGSVGMKRDTFQNGCFDRVADPDFTQPVPHDALMEELVAWRAARQAEYDAWPHTRDVTGGHDDLARQLEALGYVE